ncbi:hypothetical protein EYZ11_010203 [Aspergillus tanneri]|uniref:Uncharacterized protein n=1 Tax=Aspergillus tanneri TaxID=1220188 RepID=A0A4V3UN96_9EURO|nr:hypothetical protein EYZ11_010203 [Aspergillus tanneri]
MASNLGACVDLDTDL